MSIFIIRHAQDLPNYRGGWSKNGLTELGREQAHRLGKYLLSYKISRIITSDLPRASETADIVNEYLKVPIEYNFEWREINSGLLSGMSKIQSDEQYPNYYIEKIGIDQHFPEGESPREFYERITRAFKKLQKSVGKDENLALITHGGVIMALFHQFEGKDWIDRREYIKVEKCSISTLVFSEEGWKLANKNFYDY